jgi:dihydrofolate reductase
MECMFPTKFFHEMVGKEGGETGVDNEMAVRSFDNVGAWILGRNMFGPVRGPWPDESWRGWWGEEPSYHKPVFVLTHHARPPLEMKGGTTFHFVTGGIEEALQRATAAAGGLDVRVGGGANTIRQYLQARLIDDLHLAVRPIFLGEGEPLWSGLDMRALGYEVYDSRPGERALHVFLRKTDARP